MSLVFNTPKTGLNTSTRALQNLASGGSMKLTDISVEYTENGDYNVEIPEGYDGFSSVEVSVDVNPPLQRAVAGPIVGADTIIVPNEGYYGFSEVEIEAVKLGDVTVNPSKEMVTVSPPYGKDAMNYVYVNPVTSDIDENIKAENIKKDVSILGVTGTLEPSKTFEVTNGVKFGYSNIRSTDPLTYDFKNVTDFSDMFASNSQGWESRTIDSTKFTNAQPTSLARAFQMVHYADVSNIDTSKCTLLTGAFQYTTNSSSTGSDIIGLNNWDTSKVENMSHLFSSRYVSSHSIIPDIANWNTSNVKNMSEMFRSFGINNPKVYDFNLNWDTSNVESMSYMFSGTHIITMPQFDTHNVTTMYKMFSGCKELTTVPALDTSKVTNMDGIFDSCTALTTVNGIDYSSVSDTNTDLFGYTTSVPNLTHFIFNGKINISIDRNYSIKAMVNIDYESVKSILEAANRTDNTNAKTLGFTRTMADPDGELAALVASCATKGWTITGLTLN